MLGAILLINESYPSIQFHGNLFVDRCFVEGCVIEADADDPDPRCPGCGAHARPGVIWFGEAIPEAALENSLAAAAQCDIFLSIGTSSLVYPAAGLAEVAMRAGAVVVEVNPDPTGLSSTFHHAIAAKAGTALPAIVETL